MVIYCLQFLGFLGGLELECGWIYIWKAPEQGVTWDRTAQPSTFCVMDMFGAPFTVIFHFDFCLQFRFNLYPSEKVSWAELLVLFSCCLMYPHPWKNEGMWLSSLKKKTTRKGEELFVLSFFGLAWASAGIRSCVPHTEGYCCWRAAVVAWLPTRGVEAK